MLILLPTNGNNVRTLGKDMQHAQLHMVIDALKPTELILEIPKFEIDYQIDLVEFLKPVSTQLSTFLVLFFLILAQNPRSFLISSEFEWNNWYKQSQDQ
mgnify:FL=1